ncbi:1-acyl-sn-glycerol-3-phosphate acyltransferase [Candidatus Woesearchaeota archaeon]|nr:1-acyl-sn-glycerol-3-phosphate acyltransferase [Candidatus Woesearchaeota archaeon]
MAYPISKLIIKAIYRPWIRKIDGMENVPIGKPFIIAANHSSYFDVFLPPIAITKKVDKKIHALVNSYYWKPFITRFFLDLWESIPVFVEKDKGSKEKNKAAIEKASGYLKKEEPVMIFPEGARSKDGKLKKAYTGVARLALKSRVPVLPVGVIGSNKVLPVGKMLPRFKRCEVKIGKLIHFEKYYGKKQNEKILNEITRSIMKQIARLINQKYSY